MKNEVERLLKGRGLEVKNNKNLTENLKEWREDRNIKNSNTRVFIENILEELLEIYYVDKEMIKACKNDIMSDYFCLPELNEINTIDAIQDIQVFCINETELMGYDNIKCNSEVFKEINSREQDPQQFAEWQKFGASGKWKKSEREEHKARWYKADYESCKL